MRTQFNPRHHSPLHHTGESLGNESGIALIIVLFLLILMTILGLTMVVSVNSDMMINGYYGNTRASYYAADSGLNIARQSLINSLNGAINMNSCTGWQVGNPAPGCTVAPLGTSNAGAAASLAAAITTADAEASAVTAAALANVKSSYASFSPVNAGGAAQVANSWQSSFIIKDTANCTNSFALATPAAGGQNPVTTNNLLTPPQIVSYAYTFAYTICATGRASSLQHSAVSESGSIIVNISGPSNNTGQSFAAFGGFIQNYPLCDNPLVPGFFSGPQFSNTAFNFWNNGSYIFSGQVGQVGTKAGYWIGGTCYPSATTSYPGINATFEAGYALGAQPKILPANSFSQKWAVIDAQGCGEAGTPSTCANNVPPTDPNLMTPNPLTLYLKNINGTPYAGTGTQGVYIPYSGTTYGGVSTNGIPEGGGFYVEGNASIVLTPGTDSATPPNPTQIYKITQGSTLTTITTNPGAYTTTISSGGTTKTLTGVPINIITGSNPSTLLYVNGTITGLSGPGQGQAAIQDNAMITIAGSSNINITGDVIYKTEVVTLDTSDTSINLPASASNQVLGVFTSNGNIALQSPYSNSNLQVDGSLAAVGASCPTSSCGFVNLNGGFINTFNNVGGQIQSNIFTANMNIENTFFDNRFLSRNGFAPPWFPSTQVSESNLPAPPKPTITQQRTAWAWIAAQ